MQAARPMPAHFGIYVTDVEKMVAFYQAVFGLVISDRGHGKTFGNEIVFMSGSPEQHHQFVLASGRAPGSVSTVMQIAFMVPSIQSLRDLTARAVEHGATEVRGLNHGNALSVYYKDPEGNMVEMYVDTPWHVSQPHGEPLDLSLSDDEIMRATEEHCRKDPSFRPMGDWQGHLRARIEAAQ